MKKIKPCHVIRNEMGYWSHPNLPDFSKSPDLGEIQKWIELQQITTTRMIAILEQPSLPHHLVEEAQLTSDISKIPLPPLSDAWFLLAIVDHEDGPKAWYATRNEVGQIAPPRPDLTTQMVEFVSKHLIAQLSAMHCHSQEADQSALKRLVDGYVDGMTDAEIYELMFPGYPLADECTSVSEAVSNFSVLLRNQRRSAEREWVSHHAVVPDLKLGLPVRFHYRGNPTYGLLVGNDYEHGRHLIQVAGKTRLLNLPYERVEAA
jgi:hypothetical protein